MAHTEVTARGTSICRSCDSGQLVSVLDLGEQPLSNALVARADELPDTFPLHLRICPQCGLGQVGEFVRPERIFGDDYPYLSSTSASWITHAERYVDDQCQRLHLGGSDLVVEVASNDGYLLSRFKKRGLQVLGVEPAGNVAELARQAGVPTIGEFFGEASAARIVSTHGHPRLVAANNVMAHVPDLHDFVAGLSTLCDDQTLVTIENPSLMTLLSDVQFDTIYHEHFSYLTATSVRHVAEVHGLDLVRVERWPTHGGSNRYFLRRAGSTAPDSTVAAMLSDELREGLFDPDVWHHFAARSRATIEQFRQWLVDRRDAGARIAGYGAAAKGNTMLNAVGEPARAISFVVDASSAKQGRFLPGPQTPVFEPAHLAAETVDDVLILPWNLAAELLPLIRSLSPSAKVWVATPHMERLA